MLGITKINMFSPSCASSLNGVFDCIELAFLPKGHTHEVFVSSLTFVAASFRVAGLVLS